MVIKMANENVNLLKDVPVINNRKELKQWLRPMYIISDYLSDYDTYRAFHQKLYNLIKGCFVIKECREYPIKFKFYKEDKETYSLEFRHFIINTVVWYPFVELNDIHVLDKSFILDCYNDIPDIEEKYINNKLIATLRDYHVKSTKVNLAISEVLYGLRQISIDFSLILGLNFDMPMFIDLYNNNDEIRELMECKFDSSLQPYEIEQLLNEYEAKEIDILTAIPDNPLGILLRAKTGIKHKQLREFTISGGLKPTLTGETIPIVNENSTVVGGLSKASTFYIDALGARKSLVTNKKVMGRAGYFGKIVLMLACTLSISTTVSNCNTKHLVTYDVLNKKVLKKLDGKYYKINDDDDLKLLDANKDTHLIGKSIKVRSAATCACGNQVCPTCIGKIATINQDITDGYSAFASEEITKVINQSILSTKHLLTTNSEVIKFNKEFYDFFSICGGEITPIVNDNQKVPNINDYAIYINPNDVEKVEEMDDDSLYNTVITNGRFYVRNLVDSSVPDIEIKADGDKEIFLSEKAIEEFNRNKGLIEFQDLDDDTTIFEMVIMNNELTKPLYELMDLINKEKKAGQAETIDSISQKFLLLLIESGIHANVVDAEIIINRLIYSTENPYHRPDFTQEEMPPYDIFTVRKSLVKYRAPMVGLSFQSIKEQLLDNDFFTGRNETSFVDDYFKPVLNVNEE